MKPLSLLFFIALSYGKIINMPKLDEFYMENYDENYLYDDTEFDLNVWVLDVNEWGALRKASVDETQEFYNYAGPLIEQYESQHPTPIRVKKDDPKKPYRLKVHENKTEMLTDVLRNNIFKLINKFNMYAKPDESSPDLLKNDKESSIAIYFQAPYTSLVLKSGREQFNYFIPPPSCLPYWFYEERGNSFDEQQSYVQVPENIKNELYIALLRLL